MYDPVIGRWISVDPAKQYASPYVGMGNNPVSMSDKDGAVAGEWELNGDKEWVKTSTKGDDMGIDFYHTTDGGKNVTYVTDNNGNWATMNNGKYSIGGMTRSFDTDWGDITDEWNNGDLPQYSYFEGDHPANFEIQKHYLYSQYHERFSNSGLDKKGYTVAWGLVDVYATKSDNMQAQMMGSYNLSFYKLGGKTLVLAQDSKSQHSFYWHLPFVSNKSRGFQQNNSQANTYQSYLFFHRSPGIYNK